jgi:hypothetical protein
MNQPRTPTDRATAKRLQVRRRAKRGLVAGYIHEISGRHGAGSTRTARVEPVAKAAAGT